MEIEDNKFSKFIDFKYIQAVLRRKYFFSLFEATQIISFLKPVSFCLYVSYEKSFIFNDKYIIHAKDIKNYGCRYYIEEIL